MPNRVVPSIAAVTLFLALGACNAAPPNNVFPKVDSVSVSPQQVTDTSTPFVITVTTRDGSLERSGVIAPGWQRPGDFKIVADDRAEWRPAGSGGALPTSSVSLPVTLQGIKGASSPQNPVTTIFLQFDPLPSGGLMYKSFSATAPSPATSSNPTR